MSQAFGAISNLIRALRLAGLRPPSPPHDTTVITRGDDRRWSITQNLFEPEGENFCYIEDEDDLDRWPGGPLVAVKEIGS